MTRAADILRERAQTYVDAAPMQTPFTRRTWGEQAAFSCAVAELMERVAEHNEACRDMCGRGDQEGVACKYRQYFPRRCPDCPAINWIVAEEELAALERAITGESDATSE